MKKYQIKYSCDRQTFYERFREKTAGQPVSGMEKEGMSIGGRYENDSFSLYFVTAQQITAPVAGGQSMSSGKIPLVLSGTIRETEDGLLAEYSLNKASAGGSILYLVCGWIGAFAVFFIANRWLHYFNFSARSVRFMIFGFVFINIFPLWGLMSGAASKAQREALLKFMEDMG